MKKAIIMGASSGIGRNVALELISQGWTVCVASRRIDKLESIVVDGFPKPMIAAIDVTSDHAVGDITQIIQSMGGVDLYFHAAGVGWQNLELDEDKELRTIETNIVGFSMLVGEVFRYMSSHGGGHIAVISSIAGTKGLGPAPAYSASKSFQNTYIQALEQQANARHLNIKFTDFRPGFVATELIKGMTFPLTLDAKMVAHSMVASLDNGKHVKVIDWRWSIIVGVWRLIPNCLWRRLKLVRYPRS